jgi:parvulin-like peptidyl-prolyl isomerase
MSGKQRLGLLLFGVIFIGLFAVFAVAEGLGQPSVSSGDAALVKGAPSGDSTISEAAVRKAVLQQASQAGQKKIPKPGEKKYEELQENAFKELIQNVWIKGEAEELGISVTEKQIETELEQIIKTNFKTQATFEKFLKSSHFTEEEVNEKVETQLLGKKIQETVSNEAGSASKSEIEAYYEAEKETQFTTGASRDVRLILNEDKGEVEKAKAALEKDNSPANWKKVAPKYSTDPTTKVNGGLQPGITEEFVKGELKKAIFGSSTGELVGPVKFEKNWILVEVVKLTPEKVKSLKEVESQISSTLTQERQQEFFSEFVSGFQSKWTSRTYCAADFVENELCGNRKSSGHPSTAPPACYEANPKAPATECPAPVAQAVPALPGTVTEQKPKGEPFPQRPRPQTQVSETSLGGEEGAPPTGAPPAEAPPAEAPPPSSSGE